MSRRLASRLVAEDEMNRYVSVVHSIGSVGKHRATIYRMDGDLIVRVATLLNGGIIDGGDCAFSSGGNYLAMRASDATIPYVFKRSVDTFIPLVVTGVEPYALSGISISADGQCLACSRNTAVVQVYLRNENDEYKAIQPTGLPGNARVVKVSPDGQFLLVRTLLHDGEEYTNRAELYKRVEGVFSLVPEFMQAYATEDCVDFAFSPDGQWILLTLLNSRFVLIERTASGYEPLSIITATEAISAPCAVSNNGKHVVFKAGITPVVYRRDGHDFSRMSVQGQQGSGIRDVSITHDGEYLMSAKTETPYIFRWKYNGDRYVSLTPPVILPSDKAYACAISG